MKVAARCGAAARPQAVAGISREANLCRDKMAARRRGLHIPPPPRRLTAFPLPPALAARQAKPRLTWPKIFSFLISISRRQGEQGDPSLKLRRCVRQADLIFAPLPLEAKEKRLLVETPSSLVTFHFWKIS